MGFRDWLRRLLEGGVYESQAEIARAVGVTEGAVSLWLSGERRPDRERCDLISTATGLPVGDIVEMVSRDARDIDGNSRPRRRVAA